MARRLGGSAPSYLGNLEQGLGDVNDTAEVLDALDALLDGLGVVGAGAVQDARDLVDLLLGVVGPGGAGVLADGPEDGEQREGDDGLLVDDVQLVADGGDGQASAGGEDGGLGEGAVAGDGDGLHDALGLLLGVLLRGLEAGLGGERWHGAERKGRAETGGACAVLLCVHTGAVAGQWHQCRIGRRAPTNRAPGETRSHCCDEEWGGSRW